MLHSDFLQTTFTLPVLQFPLLLHNLYIYFVYFICCVSRQAYLTVQKSETTLKWTLPTRNINKLERRGDVPASCINHVNI